jgi:Kef-type K+ transport system membrane component KefB
MADHDFATVSVIAALAATVVISNSPTVIIAMLTDLRAAGPMSQMLLAFAVCKDLVLIVLFATVLAVGKGVLVESTSISPEFLLAVGMQLLGSVVLGGVLGVAMAWYVHRVQVHLIFFVVASCLLFALLGDQHFLVAGQEVHLEPLLVALSAGVLMQNLWPQQSEPLFHAIESMSLPVYCLFFAVAGAKVDLQAFGGLWYVSVGMVLVRVVAVWTGMAVGTKLARIEGEWVNKLWLGLIPQAGVSLVLVALIVRSFSDTEWAMPLSSMLIGMIVIHELLGPIGFRYALVSSGEAGAMTKTGSSGH